MKGLKFDAWAHHPYPTSPNLPPTAEGALPERDSLDAAEFEKDAREVGFHRTVPIWITEYGHETKPGEPHGVSTATQAAYAKQALTVAKADPNVQMFIWFVFRDSARATRGRAGSRCRAARTSRRTRRFSAMPR